jgi:predicted N-acetyltransferase YhbS
MDAGMIRDAAPRDYPAIRAVVRHAFGRADEANLVEQLRADGDVLFELVAGGDMALQGHILYSRLLIERPRSGPPSRRAGACRGVAGISTRRSGQSVG